MHVREYTCVCVSWSVIYEIKYTVKILMLFVWRTDKMEELIYFYVPTKQYKDKLILTKQLQEIKFKACYNESLIIVKNLKWKKKTLLAPKEQFKVDYIDKYTILIYHQCIQEPSSLFLHHLPFISSYSLLHFYTSLDYIKYWINGVPTFDGLHSLVMIFYILLGSGMEPEFTCGDTETLVLKLVMKTVYLQLCYGHLC